MTLVSKYWVNTESQNSQKFWWQKSATSNLSQRASYLRLKRITSNIIFLPGNQITKPLPQRFPRFVFPYGGRMTATPPPPTPVCGKHETASAGKRLYRKNIYVSQFATKHIYILWTKRASHWVPFPPAFPPDNTLVSKRFSPPPTPLYCFCSVIFPSPHLPLKSSSLIIAPVPRPLQSSCLLTPPPPSPNTPASSLFLSDLAGAYPPQFLEAVAGPGNRSGARLEPFLTTRSTHPRNPTPAKATVTPTGHYRHHPPLGRNPRTLVREPKLAPAPSEPLAFFEPG